MKINADTNLLVRAITRDDAKQSRVAEKALAEADLVAIAIPTLCELAWVLSRGYGIGSTEVAGAIRKLLEVDNVAVNRASAEAGLEMLESGGDFADGAIAYEGLELGAEAFVSFDKAAVKKLTASGKPAVLLRT